MWHSHQIDTHRVRPWACPQLARPGRSDGRSWTGLAMSVTSMLGQIRVAKDFCSSGRKTLGFIAWLAEFWTSGVSAGHTRLSCNCCVAPTPGSVQSMKPRLISPGDPASRLIGKPVGNSISSFDVAQHSCCRPKNLPLYGRLIRSSQLSFRSRTKKFDGTVRRTEFNGVRSVTPRHDLPPASADRRRSSETTFTQRASERSGPFDACCGVDTISYPSFFMEKDSQTSTKPIKTFRFRGICASVFENTTDKGDSFMKTSIVRTYKDGRDFKTTPTFSRDELPIVTLVSQQAYDFILNEEREQRDAEQR